MHPEGSETRVWRFGGTVPRASWLRREVEREAFAVPAIGSRAKHLRKEPVICGAGST